MNEERRDPWADAFSVPVEKGARVEQVGVDRSHGAFLHRLGKFGVVIQRNVARVVVRFDGEEYTAAIQPYLLRVAEPSGSETEGIVGGQAGGFHWHVYSRKSSKSIVGQTPADREARLAARSEVVLCSPVAVAERVVPRSKHDGCWLVWRPVDGRWHTHSGSRDALYREVVDLAARDHSIYLATETRADGRRVEVFAEGVTSFDCPAHDEHNKHGQET